MTRLGRVLPIPACVPPWSGLGDSLSDSTLKRDNLDALRIRVKPGVGSPDSGALVRSRTHSKSWFKFRVALSGPRGVCNTVKVYKSDWRGRQSVSLCVSLGEDGAELGGGESWRPGVGGALGACLHGSCVRACAFLWESECVREMSALTHSHRAPLFPNQVWFSKGSHLGLCAP
jgi:hypothetical protein